MQVFRQLEQWLQWRKLQQQSIGFVATMGALHAGHLELVEQSLNNNVITVVSIFINPAQFDQQADLDAYPVELVQDLQLLQSAGVDAVLIPTVEEIYADKHRYKVIETDYSLKLCGAHRPAHFEGVLTVVLKLLNLVRPQRAYFGEKDWQQLTLVSEMVQAFFMSVEIVPVATIRESDGLAMSSRNSRLSADERLLASELYSVISSADSAAKATQQLLSAGFEVDYVADHNSTRGQRRLAAVRLGNTRLIDNVGLDNE